MGTGCALASAGAAFAKSSVTVDYRFEFPGAGRCVDARTGCVPWAGDLTSHARELHPVVPIHVARILIEDGETLDEVRLTTSAPRSMLFTPRIAARQEPLTPGIVIDREVPSYGGGSYPADWRGETRVTRFRGRTIVEVQLFPLRILGDGRAEYVEHASLTVTTKSGTYGDRDEDGGDAGIRTASRDLREAQLRADNVPAAVKGRIVPPDEEVGYLVIGPRALIGEPGDTPLQPLIDDKENRQLVVFMAALEDVSPSRDPAQIRDYIRERYQQDSIDYVLIVGDKGRFPWKYVRSGVNDRSDPVPSDQYYGCLDGDFSRPERIDWACEVSVGRVGARTRDDVANWVGKSLALQAAAKAGHAGRILNFGEKLDGSTLGDRVLDFLLNGTDRAPTTTGFPRSIGVTKLYETFRSQVSGGEFIDTLNDGDFHVVNHLGHANETYVFRTTAAQLGEFRSRPAFFYSQGCYPNDPDTDNWTIRAVRMPDYGPAAMISNSRYGWYAPGSSDEGSSSMLHRTFWSMRFGGGVKSIGTMNHKAKEIVVGVDRSAIMIYTALESNLIGDPELDLGI
jgi:hypothetical protein